MRDCHFVNLGKSYTKLKGSVPLIQGQAPGRPVPILQYRYNSRKQIGEDCHYTAMYWEFALVVTNNTYKSASSSMRWCSMLAGMWARNCISMTKFEKVQDSLVLKLLSRGRFFWSNMKGVQEHNNNWCKQHVNVKDETSGA